MPRGRIDTVLSQLPVVSRVTARLDAARAELERLQHIPALTVLSEPECSHAVVQEYEFKHTERWVSENASWVWEMVDRAATGERDVHEVLRREFFADDIGLWKAFADHLEGKALLDVGSGPVPMPAMWNWATRRLVIDPLAKRYHALIATECGRSWWDGLEVRSVPAEEYVSDLAGIVDGAIVCRNCLDHCAEPYMVLSNLASYAAHGSYLLLWSDLYHTDGHDEGHTNVTRDRLGFRRHVENLGWTIIRETPSVRGTGEIEFGCFAVKRWAGMPPALPMHACARERCGMSYQCQLEKGVAKRNFGQSHVAWH